MKHVAKLLLMNEQNQYLLLYRSGHPAFGDDPDLAGGTLEEGEQPKETMVREVLEEVGVVIREYMIQELYRGNEYSAGHDTEYSLFVATLDHTPDIHLSWEHASYTWLGRDVLMSEAKRANDTYMHMVHAVLASCDGMTVINAMT